MKFKKNIVKTIIFIYLSINGIGQTMVLPDTNFRNKLLRDYPTLMIGNELNIAAASTFFPDLNLLGSNIENLTGIEHFVSLYKLEVSVNKLKRIPELTGFKNLQYLYANFNQIDSLPNLSKLTKLIEIQAAYNNLTSLPKLENQPNLNFLFVSDNKIKELPNLSKLTKLTRLYIGNNPLDSFPILSKNKLLKELQCHLTPIKEIPYLDSLTNLEKLYCEDCKLETLDGLSQNIKLTSLLAQNNKLTSLPQLTNKPNLDQLNVSNNQLTFNDLIPLANIGISRFIYAPQDSIKSKLKLTERELRPFVISSNVDINLNNIVYRFYKNGSLVQNSNVNVYKIASLAKLDSGHFYVEVSSTALPNLTLYEELFTLKIADCMDIKQFDHQINQQDCGKGMELEILTQFEGAVRPYRYVLGLNPSLANSSNVINNHGIFENTSPGRYNLTFFDFYNCTTSKEIILKKLSNCDQVISISNEQTSSSYFIEEKGNVKIVDVSGKIVQQLVAPVVWSGEGSNGSLVDAGYYVILLNDQKLTNITVIK